jgi:hypothetical protein
MKHKIDINYDIEANNDDLEIEIIGPPSPDNNIDVVTNNGESEEARFTYKLNKSLEQISENFNTSFYAKRDYESNSPITLSPNNSDFDSDSEHHVEYGNFHKLSSSQVESVLDKYYDDDDYSSKHSNELDILITYLKGQKNLYIQSKNVTQYTLNALLIPSLLITASITVFAPFIQEYSWSGGFISGLNAISTVLITLVNYLKLESSIELFYHTANQYDKLETGLEFISSKLLFIENAKERSHTILEKIQDTEKKISEIKELNTLFVPEIIRSMFPVICNINVFSLIKRIETYKKNLIRKFRDIKNEIRYINHLRQKNDSIHESRLKLLVDVKEKIKTELVYYKNAYQYVDDVFTQEIKQAQDARSDWRCWFRYKLTNYSNLSKNNPIVNKYILSAYSS